MKFNETKSISILAEFLFQIMKRIGYYRKRNRKMHYKRKNKDYKIISNCNSISGVKNYSKKLAIGILKFVSATQYFRK